MGIKHAFHFFQQVHTDKYFVSCTWDACRNTL